MQLKNKILTIMAAGALLVSSYASAQQVIPVSNVYLNTKNTLVMRGEINDEMVIDAQLKLAELAKTRGNESYTIYIVLDSPGGSIISGEDFIAFARLYRNVDTITIFAASMASAIVQAMPGNRWNTVGGIQMFHRASAGFRGQIENGEVETTLELVKNLVRGMEIRSSKRIGISLDEYKTLVKDEWWLLGAQNITKKTADGMVQIVCSQDLIDSRDSMKIFSLFGGAEVLLYSGCPLLRAPLPSRQQTQEE